MSVIGAVTNVFIVVMIFAMLPLFIGVYVYRDAKRRGMSAWVWTVVAVLAPSFIGLIIYLLVRSDYADLECPQCGGPVTEQYVVCPHCGARLQAGCPQCGALVEPGWVACPHCAAPLAGTWDDVQPPLAGAQNDVQPPVRRKDSALWKILAVVILAPAVLLVLMVLSLRVASGSASAAYSGVTVEEYMATQIDPTVAEQVQAWLTETRQTGRPAALRYQFLPGESTQFFYLVYLPGVGNPDHYEFGCSTGLFGGVTITLQLQSDGGDDTLLCVQSSAAKTPRLHLIVNGREVDCDVRDVDFNPTLYFIETYF